jgi:hypothetical protein
MSKELDELRTEVAFYARLQRSGLSDRGPTDLDLTPGRRTRAACSTVTFRQRMRLV